MQTDYSCTYTCALIAVRGGLIEQFPMKLSIPLHGLNEEKSKHDMRDNYIRAIERLQSCKHTAHFSLWQTNEINSWNDEMNTKHSAKKDAGVKLAK